MTEATAARTLVPGEAGGIATVLDEPLSLWGGLDAATGHVGDPHHPQSGALIAGRVLVMPSGRGSSSSPSVLAEAIRAGTGPVAIVLREPDPLVALGAIVAAELYGLAVPVVVADAAAYRRIAHGATVSVRAGEDRAVIETSQVVPRPAADRLCRVAVACPSCGDPNGQGARFCSSCGARLALASAPVQERRLVTILFADLAGFTQRSDNADPEDVRRVLVPFHSIAKEEIERFGGTLDKFIGDAAMGVFGAPVAHEDDPERAVRAALAIRSRMTALQMAVRVAVNTGEAVVTFATGPQIGENVAGDVVNTASRLQGVAPVGGVVVGAATEQATRGAFAYTRMDPVAVKGKADVVAVWLAGSMHDAMTTKDEDVAPPFVGRDRERRLLADVLARTGREGGVGLVTVVGDPGIGKSRLVADFGDQVRGHGAIAWHRGRCLPYGESITFAALEQILRSLAGIHPTEDRNAASSKLEVEVARLEERSADREWLTRSLAPLLGLVDPEGTPSANREELFAAWTRFLARAAARSPMVLVIEDLHWAADAMVAFLEHLMAEAAQGATLLLVTARPELLTSRPSWGTDHPGATTITLAPLDDNEMSTLLDTLLAGSVLPAHTRDPLMERAGGNPLFALEFVHMLEDRAAANGVPEAGSGRTPPISVPLSVQALIAARLDALDAGERSRLQDASVVGERFWPGALRELNPSAASTEDALGGLQRRGLIWRSAISEVEGEAEYAFSHGLIRDVAYGQLPRAARATRHRRFAAWLEVAGERIPDVADRLAYHAVRALELATEAGMDDDVPVMRAVARRFLVLAAERQQHLDARQAAEYYRQAVALTDAGDPGGAELARVATMLAWRSGSITSDEAVAAFRLALEEALEAEDRLTAGRVMRRLYFQLSQQGDTAEAHDVLERAITLVEEEPEPGPLLAELYACRAEVEMFAGLSDGSLTWAERALAIPRTQEITLMALHLKGNARCELGDLGGLDDLREAAALSQGAGRALDIVTSHSYLAEWVGMVQGPHAALAMSDDALTLCESRGLMGQEMWTRAERLWLLYDAGEWDAILRQTQVLQDWCDRHGDNQTEAAALPYRARVLVVRGRVDEAVALAHTFLPAGRAIEDLQILAPALVVAAQIAHASNATHDALELLREFDAVTRDAPAGYREVLLPDAVRTSLAAGDPGLAAALLRDRPAQSPRVALAIDSSRAALAEARQELDVAAEAYGDVADRWGQWGGVPERAFALAGRARTLRALGHRGSADAAASLAADLFAKLGVPRPT